MNPEEWEGVWTESQLSALDAVLDDAEEQP